MSKLSSMVLTLFLVVAACKKKQPEMKPEAPTGSQAGSAGSAAEPTGSNVVVDAGPQVGSNGSSAGSGSGSGSAAPSSKTGFAPFDDAFAGSKPWLSADEAKSGIVELDAYEDLSGKTKGTSSVKRLCGAAASKAADATGAAFVTRTKDGNHDAPTCTTEGESTSCVSPGIAEGDTALVIEYRQTAGNWKLIGVQSIGTGMQVPKLEAEYKKLLATKCK